MFRFYFDTIFLYLLKIRFTGVAAKIQALKRSVPKGDKRKKKEIAAEIALLEAKLEEKHDNENKSAQNCEEVSKYTGYMSL